MKTCEFCGHTSPSKTHWTRCAKTYYRNKARRARGELPPQRPVGIAWISREHGWLWLDEFGRFQPVKSDADKFDMADACRQAERYREQMSGALVSAVYLDTNLETGERI